MQGNRQGTFPPNRLWPESIEPYRVALSAKLQREFFFHLEGFCPGAHRRDVVEQTAPQIEPVTVHNVGTEFVATGIPVAFFVLLEALLRSFAGHAHIKTFQYSVELRVGFPKPAVFCKNLFGEFYYIDAIHVAKCKERFWRWQMVVVPGRLIVVCNYDPISIACYMLIATSFRASRLRRLGGTKLGKRVGISKQKRQTFRLAFSKSN